MNNKTLKSIYTATGTLNSTVAKDPKSYLTEKQLNIYYKKEYQNLSFSEKMYLVINNIEKPKAKKFVSFKEGYKDIKISPPPVEKKETEKKLGKEASINKKIEENSKTPTDKRWKNLFEFMPATDENEFLKKLDSLRFDEIDDFAKLKELIPLNALKDTIGMLLRFQYENISKYYSNKTLESLSSILIEPIQQSVEIVNASDLFYLMKHHKSWVDKHFEAWKNTYVKEKILAKLFKTNFFITPEDVLFEYYKDEGILSKELTPQVIGFALREYLKNKVVKLFDNDPYYSVTMTASYIAQKPYIGIFKDRTMFQESAILLERLKGMVKVQNTPNKAFEIVDKIVLVNEPAKEMNIVGSVFIHYNPEKTMVANFSSNLKEKGKHLIILNKPDTGYSKAEVYKNNFYGFNIQQIFLYELTI
jgi:hypothetical protein